MTHIQIENIIANAQISELIDIKFLSEKITDCSYNPSEFNGLSIKYEKENIAVIILETGKVVCTGAKEISNAVEKIKKVANQLKKFGLKIKKDYEIKIENITVTTNLKKDLHLENIAKNLIFQEFDFHPETFPGLIYKMDDLQIILIIFNTGKIVCTGAKNIDDATNSINKIKERFTSIGVL